jgi:excisionase family DNA binding protein
MKAVDKEVLTTGDVSRLFGMREMTIRRWSDRGKIPSFRVGIGRRDRRFRLRDLEPIMVRVELDRTPRLAAESRRKRAK